ncbi:MAG TPA: hypothetical protein DHV15_04155 [Treponema sp.]|uniref:Uncharacterized protein n=1 Tax=Treponema denticola (strain ATCC 35405 / DSM 14222 / CIP 103919 / JCM 8153 / KCTC 15104) TaxID=243275 RepID=Q73KT3_TREDE|nr:hypothetical protein TDE_2134 [Treponema denticola ATCC 35405]HCY94692.1 hypothetical protein [Treponema sp.]
MGNVHPESDFHNLIQFIKTFLYFTIFFKYFL